MPKKKIQETPIINDQDVEIDNDDLEEISEISRKVEVLIGENFKIIETRYSKDVYERVITKKTLEDGTETTTESWKNRGYCGTYLSACKTIKEVMAKNHRFDKKIINSIDELVKITKESYEKTDKLFEGIES